MTEFEALDAAIRAGDVSGLVQRLRPLTAPQRHAHRAALLQLRQRLDEVRVGAAANRTREQVWAMSAALVLCGTAADLVRAWIDEDLLVSLGREFRPRSLDGLADVLLGHSPRTIRAVQALIGAGLAERPASEAYTLGLIALPDALRDAGRLEAALAADPGLARALLRVFAVEGTSDTSLASSDKYNHVPGLAWGTILLGLVGRGATTRAELLDLTLGALENDWPPFRAGWFSRFHAELAPDVAAMRPHRPRYLALCHGRIAPTVGLALGALLQLDDDAPLDSAALLEALRPVLAGAVKAQVEAALKLVDRVVQREPAHAAAAAALVAPALLIESAPLQKAVLRRLEAWGVDAAAREVLQGVAPAIAAVNRPAWARLAGEAAAPPPAAAPEPATPRVGALDAARRVEPPGTVDALVACIAHVFENDTDTDAVEQALAGVVQQAPFDDAARRALAPVLKRAPKVRKPVAQLLARLLIAVAEGRALAVSPGLDALGNPSPALALLLRRVDALAAVAAQGARVPPLAAPTHRRGFIAPAALVERVALHQARGVQSPRIEQVLALLRLSPGADETVRTAARRLADEPFVRALRHALGDAVAFGAEHELFAAAARIRHPDGDDEALLRHQGDLGPDAARAARFDWRVHSWENRHEDRTWHFHDLVVESAPPLPGEPLPDLLAVQRHPPPFDASEFLVRWWSFAGIDDGAVGWSATLLPSCPQAFFAEGARAVGSNLDWWEAQWHNAGYLRALLDPTAPLGSMGTLLLALGLVGKEPGQTAIAVDALVQSQRDGRLDAAALGDTLRRLFATPMPKAARLRASLLAATRADAALRRPVFEVLAAVVTAEPAPREFATLLDLLLDLKLALGLPLPAATRADLAARRLTGRARTLQKDLLA